MLADSWRKPEGMVNETSPYRRFNEILPAHQTRAESDYTYVEGQTDEMKRMLS